MIKLLKFSFQIPNCLKCGEEFISQEECQKHMAKCTDTKKYPAQTANGYLTVYLV